MDHLAVGDTLLLTFAELGDRLTGVLVGKQEGQGLVVYAHLPDKTRRRVRKNPAVTVQFAVESRLLGFPTRVLSNPPSEADCLLMLDWPESVENMDPRRERRLSCRFPGVLSCNGTALPCLVEDLSASALRVRLRGAQAEARWRELESGLTATVDFFPLGPEAPCRASGQVLRTFMRQNRPSVVLLLDESDAPLRERLKRHIDQVLDEPT